MGTASSATCRIVGMDVEVSFVHVCSSRHGEPYRPSQQSEQDVSIWLKTGLLRKAKRTIYRSCEDGRSAAFSGDHKMTVFEWGIHESIFSNARTVLILGAALGRNYFDPSVLLLSGGGVWRHQSAP